MSDPRCDWCACDLHDGPRMCARIRTADGHAWEVLQRTDYGDPLVVQHEEKWLRGSFLEAAMNHALAVHRLKRELVHALPAWLRGLSPAPFWVEM